MLATLVLSLLPSVAAAPEESPDLIVLANDKEVSCRVLYEDDQTVIYRAKRKEHEVALVELQSIHTVERSLREFLAAYDETQYDDLSALARLAASCEENELHAEARNLWIRILTLDAENEQAWTKLGGTKGRKGWRLKVRGRFYTLQQLRERVSDWKNAMEVPTAHFLLKTDVPPELALDIALNLERAYLTFYDLVGPQLKLYVFDDVPEVHIFADHKDYPTPPNHEVAWFHPSENTLHVDGSVGSAAVNSVVGELTYCLIYNFFHRTLGKTGMIEPWLRHGMATAFGAAVRREEGQPLRWDFDQPYLPYFRAHARDAEPLTLKQVIRAGLASFDSGEDGPRFTAQAYTLLRFLARADDGKYRPALAEYLRSSYAGKGSTTQFEKLIGMKLEEVERRWTAYVKFVAE